MAHGRGSTRLHDRNRDLPLGQKLAIIAQVAEGLAFAHSRGIAHGNLKPSNIFVDPARDVSILDFGVAKWLAAILAAGARPEGLVAGYLAPEQVLGQPFDARSDIFALGVMLYEFASGKHPFSADPNLVPREIVHSEAEPLRKAGATSSRRTGAIGSARHSRKIRRSACRRRRSLLRAYTSRRSNFGVRRPPQSFPTRLRWNRHSCRRPLLRRNSRFLKRRAASRFSRRSRNLRQRPYQRHRWTRPRRQRLRSARGRKTPLAEQKPWTSRSYAANRRFRPSPMDLPKPPVNPAAVYQSSSTPAPTEPPAFQPPQSFLKPAASPAAPTSPSRAE